MRANAPPLLVLSALVAVYLIWGSTYLAIRFALEGYPPLFFPGVRFVFAGGVLLIILRLRGHAGPTRRQWINSLAMGVLLLNIGNGGVVLAERSVGSALAATAVATVPLWATLFAGIWGAWPQRLQWIGLLLGFAGIVTLNFGGDFAANPISAGLLLFSAASWAFGSVWSRRLDLPKGLMSSAAQMLMAGLVFLIGSRISGEHWHLLAAPRAMAGLLYLTLMGSLLAFSAYIFLIQNVSAALATSYAYANPVVAVLLGVTLGHESFVRSELLAIALVLIGVVLIVLYNQKPDANTAAENRS